MRIKKDIAEKDGTGSVRISAEVAEDMWHVYNIVQPGDEVTAGTTRKVRSPRRMRERMQSGNHSATQFRFANSLRSELPCC